MHTFDSMLSRSIQHYQGILQLLEQMEREMGTADPLALQGFSSTLERMQGQAAQLDREIAPLLKAQASKNEQTADLAKQRADLVNEILEVNQRICAKASGVKSLLAHEMGKLRTGLTALSGYRQPQRHRGRITNCSS